MRRLGAVAFGLPIIGLVYVRAALRRSAALRIALAVVVGGLLGGSAFALAGTDAISARPPLAVEPVPPAAFRTTLRTGVGLHDPISIGFDRPMDAGSLAAAVTVTPAVEVRLDLGPDERSLIVTPARLWSPATFYSISVGVSARARDGGTLGRPARASFVTRPAGSAALAAEASASPGADPLRPVMSVRSDVPIDAATLRAGLRVSPAIAVVVDGVGPDAEPATAFQIRPASTLALGASYRFSLDPRLVDADGARLDVGPAITVHVPEAPTVIRFRPGAGAKGVARDARISVRFSERMNPATTTAALRATVKGSRVALRSTRWAEGGTVLVAVPRSLLPAGATVTVTVDTQATASSGVPLEASASATFSVIAAPKPAATTSSRPAAKRAPKPVASGTSAGSATWYAVETYYLRLMNCTRTGGWVTSSGSCSSPGGRNVAPLALSAGISSKVSRPYAKYLATHGACDHFIGGTPGDRLRRAGYTSYRWGENLGCRSGDPYAAVLGSHLYFQSEKSYGGGHYVNLMNALYDRAGIGVWVSSGRVRLVVDFYHP